LSILKHLKTLQHVSITIQIIFRELVGSLLKLPEDDQNNDRNILEHF